MDALSGAPIKGVTLILNSDRPQVFDSATDLFGKFDLHAAQRAYSLTATAPGYSRQTARVDCRAASEVKDLKLSLSPQAVISGRVTGDDGSPFPGAAVTLLHQYYLAGEKRYTPAGGAVTGDQGQFTLDNLSPGTYFLAATPPAAVKKTDRPGYVTTFYPSAMDATGAAPLHVRGATELGGSDIRLLRAESFTVRATVLPGDPGESVRDVVVTLIPSDPARFRPHVTIRDDKGRFEFNGVVPGSYTLLARKVGKVTPSARLKLDITDGDRTDLELPLTAGAAAHITLTSDDNDKRNLSPAFVGFVPWDDAGDAYVADSKGGAYGITGLPLGPYRVMVGLRDAYAKTLRVDGRDTPDWIADLSSPGEHQIEIAVGFDAGTVAGYARDGSGNPAAKALVTIVPAGSVPLTGPQYGVTISDEQGKFIFTRVPPGHYKLYGWENVPPGLVQNRTLLGQFATQSTDVQVQPGIAVNADANVIAASATAALQ